MYQILLYLTQYELNQVSRASKFLKLFVADLRSFDNSHVKPHTVIKSLGYAFEPPQFNPDLGVLRFYFSPSNENTNLFPEFLQTLILNKKVSVKKHEVQGYTGNEYCYTIKLLDIKDQINSKSILELMQILGPEYIPSGANFMVLSNTWQHKYIDSGSEVVTKYSKGEIVLFQIYYKSKMLARLANLYLINTFCKDRSGVINETSSVYDQGRYNKTESVLTLKMNDLDLNDMKIQKQFIKAMKILLTPELYQKNLEIFNSLKTPLIESAEAKSGCQLM